MYDNYFTEAVDDTKDSPPKNDDDDSSRKSQQVNQSVSSAKPKSVDNQLTSSDNATCSDDGDRKIGTKTESESQLEKESKLQNEEEKLEDENKTVGGIEHSEIYSSDVQDKDTPISSNEPNLPISSTGQNEEENDNFEMVSKTEEPGIIADGVKSLETTGSEENERSDEMNNFERKMSISLSSDDEDDMDMLLTTQTVPLPPSKDGQNIEAHAYESGKLPYLKSDI